MGYVSHDIFFMEQITQVITPRTQEEIEREAEALGNICNVSNDFEKKKFNHTLFITVFIPRVWGLVYISLFHIFSYHERIP